MQKPPLVQSKVVNADLFQQLTEDEGGFEQLSEWLKSTAGIYLPLSQKNLTLMAARLSKVMTRFSIATYAECYRRLLKGETELQQAFIEAMTTNKTDFYREAHHFEVLPRVLNEIKSHKDKQRLPRELRVWCAAASRGHEPYTILFTLLEAGLDPKQWNLKFLASDIDKKVLSQASRGIYKEEDLNGVPDAIRSKYFETYGSERDRFRVREPFRSMITFALVNLVQFPYPFQHKFDIIFCRNVLIYFDGEMTAQVKQQLAASLAMNGFLFIGHSETGSGRIETLQTIEAALYKKQDVAS